MHSKMIMNTFKALTVTAMAGLIATTPAYAANACKNVDLSFTNNTGKDINIVDVDYWDPAKGSNGGWRSEPVKNETIRHGKTWSETRNLEKVNERSTKVRFEYRVKGKLGGWSMKKYRKTTSSKVCSNRIKFSASIS